MSAVMPSVQRRFELKHCTLHIIRNILSNYPGSFRDEHASIIWELQQALDKSKYDSQLAVLQIACGEKVREYVEQIDPHTWCVYPNIKTKMYGCRTTNFVESEHSTAKQNGIRYKLPFAFMKSFVDFMREDFKRKSDNANMWTEEGRLMTPGANAVYEKQHLRLGEYVTDLVSDDIAHVYSKMKNKVSKRRVVISKREYSCGFFDQWGIPCRHFIAALDANDRLGEVFDYFDDCYRVSEYSKAFLGKYVLPPIEEEFEREEHLPSIEDQLKPPIQPPVLSGRGASNRIASRGERSTGSHYRPRSTKCKQTGHNKRRCPTNNTPAEAPSDHTNSNSFNSIDLDMLLGE